MKREQKAEPDRVAHVRDNDSTVVVGPALTAVVLCLAIGVAFGSAFTYVIMTRMQVERQREMLAESVNTGGQPADQVREYADYLREKGLREAAIQQYRRYLGRYTIPAGERLEVCLTVAQLARDAGDFRVALQFAYQAELLTPSGDVQQQLDAIVLDSLRALGDEEALARERAAREAESVAEEAAP